MFFWGSGFPRPYTGGEGLGVLRLRAARFAHRTPLRMTAMKLICSTKVETVGAKLQNPSLGSLPWFSPLQSDV